VIDRLGVHGAHDANLIRDLCGVREQFAKPGTRLSVLRELEQGGLILIERPARKTPLITLLI